MNITHNIPDADLPFADRKTADTPGHWLLARLGKRVLRPGGLGLTLKMLTAAKLAGKDVVELAPGLGRTASEIVAIKPKSYIGVDRDPDAAKIAGRVVAPIAGKVINADAQDTGLESESADVVVGEAMLTMQTDKTKRVIIAEAARVLRPGGCYAIHELGLRPDSLSAELKDEISKDLARTIKVNARPLTVAEWSALLEEAGLQVEWSGTAAMALLNMPRNIRDEGFFRTLKIIRNVIRDKDARKRVLTMKALFKKHANQMCGVALVARKP